MRCVVMLLCLQASNVIIAVSGIFEESKAGFDSVLLGSTRGLISSASLCYTSRCVAAFLNWRRLSELCWSSSTGT